MQVAELQAQVSELKFDRSKWKPVRFDQMAQNITDRVDNPAEAGVDRYVGLEHLDPHSLKLRRWGSPSDVEATKLRFEPGDIIFGKRRAYQRKLAIADFEGICSAHSMVLRANESAVAPGYLPVFMQSEAFFETALKISVGGLSPTINWRELARQEFILPPKEDQRRIADLILAIVKAEEFFESSAGMVQSVAESYFESELTSRQLEPKPLGSLLLRQPRSGYSANEVQRDTGHCVMSLAALSRTGYVPGQFKSVEPIDPVLRARVRFGDFLISRSNTIEMVGLVGIFDEDLEHVSFPDTMMVLDLNRELVNDRFLEAYLLSRMGRAAIRRIAAGTSDSMKKINKTNLAELPILLPELSHQNDLVESLSEHRSQRTEIEAHKQRLVRLKRSICQQVFEGVG